MAQILIFINGYCELFFSNMTKLLHSKYFYCYFSTTYILVLYIGATKLPFYAKSQPCLT